MIDGLDSATPPTIAQAAAAAKAGVGLWNGYISTAPYDGNSHFGLWHPWPWGGFVGAGLCGSTPIAFCSGQDDPAALKAQALGWGVRLCLDVEIGIRSDGPWVQPWLDASGAGLYGNYGVHTGRTAAFHVLSAYPGSGDVEGTWWAATPRPASPCGWQWAGTHTEFGVGVDRGDYDDWFAGLHGVGGGSLGGVLMALTDAQQADLYAKVVASYDLLSGATSPYAELNQDIEEIQTGVAGLVAQGVPPANLQPVLDAIAQLSTKLGNLNLKAA